MIYFFVRIVKWINANKIVAIGLYIILPILSFYIHLYHNVSQHTMSLLLFINFIIRIIVSAIAAIYILSLWKPPKKSEKEKYQKEKKKRKRELAIFWITKISIGLMLIIVPLIISQNIASTYKKDKLVNESIVVNGVINGVIYGNDHWSPSGYTYEFFINDLKYTGQKNHSNGKVGQRIDVSYYIENPWINERIK